MASGRTVIGALLSRMTEDGWESVLNGLGDLTRDRTVGLAYARPAFALTQVQLDALYRHNGIASKIIDMPVDDALRPGYAYLTDDDEVGEAIVTAGRSLRVDDGSLIGRTGVLAAVGAAQKAADLYGGALIVGLLEDGLDPSLPLAEESLQSLRGVVVLDRHSVSPAKVGTELVGWDIGGLRRVHPSRCIALGGSPLTASIYASSGDGWPDSRLQRVVSELGYEGSSAQTAAHLAQEAVTGKYIIPGLNQLISEKGSSWVRSYMAIQHAMRSAMNAVLVDSDGGGYSQDTVDFSGLVALLAAWPERVSAVAEIPMTLLYGKSAPGMNATGEADLRGYYDRVDGRYRGETGKLTLALRQLLRWVMLASDGPTSGEVVDGVIEWGSLWTPSALERAQTRALTAQSDAAYIQAGVLDPTEVAESRFGGREWTAETTLDREARDRGDIGADDGTPT